VTEKIENPVLAFNASPNSLVTGTFHIATGNSTGTSLFYLQAYTYGASFNYSVPVIIVSKPAIVNAVITPSTTPTSITSAIEAHILAFKYYIIAILAVAIAIGIAAYVRSARSKTTYSAERAKRLIELREHIKRGYSNEAVYDKNRLAERRRG
ncbi:MAG: hypothetical protein ACP5MZ_03740, partial [Candidatus Micrarchaeia archaeon]